MSAEVKVFNDTLAEKFFLPALSGRQVSIAELRQRFDESKIGKDFYKQDPRYNKIFPLTEGKSIEYIGNDACPVMHQFELADRHLLDVVSAEYTSQTLLCPDDSQLALLHFVCSFHDIGESEHVTLIEAGLTPIGDIPSGQKTETDRRNEEKNVSYLLSYFFSDIDPELLKRAEAIIAHKPRPSDTTLHEIYEAAHWLQTFETARLAAVAATRESILSQDRMSLMRLGSIVTEKCVGKLEKYRYFKAVDSVLDTKEQGVSRLVHTVTAENRHYHEKCCPTPSML